VNDLKCGLQLILPNWVVIRLVIQGDVAQEDGSSKSFAGNRFSLSKVASFSKLNSKKIITGTKAIINQ
jgi:hypothetical protein